MAEGKKPAPFNNPFAAHKAKLKEAVAEPASAPSKKAPAVVKRPPTTEPELDDAALFMRAVGNLNRRPDPRGKPEPPPPPKAEDLHLIDEDAEVLAELAGLVEGTTRFDIADSDEFIEGCVEGLDRRIIRRLAAGEFAVRAHLDLHGMTRDPARIAVEEFITKARAERQRCVLIVHGRGLNSKDNVPVLKSLLKGWLERGRIGRNILAFATARPHDGGAGAVYVLLRR